MHFRKFLSSSLVAAGLATSALAQGSAAPANFEIILNTADSTASGACRVFYELVNHTDTTFDLVQYDVFFLDADGLVLMRQVLPFDWVRAGHTKFESYRVAADGLAIPCESIAQVVVNDSEACVPAGAAADDLALCRDFAPDSRYAIPLD